MTIAALCSTKNSVILKAYNQSNIEQTASYRFFLRPVDSEALLGMPDIEMVDILKKMCDVMEDLHKSRMFDSEQCRNPTATAAKQSLTEKDR